MVCFPDLSKALRYPSSCRNATAGTNKAGNCGTIRSAKQIGTTEVPSVAAGVFLTLSHR